MKVQSKPSMSRLAMLFTIRARGFRLLSLVFPFLLKPAVVDVTQDYADPKARRILFDLVAAGHVEALTPDPTVGRVEVRITKAGKQVLNREWKSLTRETRSWLLSQAVQEKG